MKLIAKFGSVKYFWNLCVYVYTKIVEQQPKGLCQNNDEDNISAQKSFIFA